MTDDTRAKCPRCWGVGSFRNGSITCEFCKGEGYVVNAAAWLRPKKDAGRVDLETVLVATMLFLLPMVAVVVALAYLAVTGR